MDSPHLLTPAAVATHLEHGADWVTHRDSVARSIAPVGALEEALAERIALLLWRLARVARFETEAIRVSQAEVEPDWVERQKYTNRVAGGLPSHPEDLRWEVGDQRRRAALLKRFPRLADGARLTGENAVVILEAAARSADVDLYSLELPGIGEDDVLEELPGWTAARVRECLEAVAVNGESPAELLEIALRREERHYREASARSERAEADLDRMRRERLLPCDPTLQKVSRYEAHLSRELTQALADLARLRARQVPAGGPLRVCAVDLLQPISAGLQHSDRFPTPLPSCSTNS